MIAVLFTLPFTLLPLYSPMTFLEGNFMYHPLSTCLLQLYSLKYTVFSCNAKLTKQCLPYSSIIFPVCFFSCTYALYHKLLYVFTYLIPSCKLYDWPSLLVHHGVFNHCYCHYWHVSGTPYLLDKWNEGIGAVGLRVGCGVNLHLCSVQYGSQSCFLKTHFFWIISENEWKYWLMF